MTLTIYEELEQGTPEWLQARAGIVTASVVGKLLTSTGKVANNDTSRALMDTLALEHVTGRVDPMRPTRAMEAGSLLEPHARDYYAGTGTRWPVEQVGFYRRDEDEWSLGYSPDGVIGEHGLLEIKSRTPLVQLRTLRTGLVPAANVAQLQAGMLTTGRRWIDYVSFSPGMPLFVQRVTPDKFWQEAIVTACRNYRDHLDVFIENWEAWSREYKMTEWFDPFDQEEEIIYG